MERGEELMTEISKTKQANIDRAVRQLERGFKILNDNKCSVFCSETCIAIFAVPELPREHSGGVDSGQIANRLCPDCDYDVGGW